MQNFRDRIKRSLISGLLIYDSADTAESLNALPRTPPNGQQTYAAGHLSRDVPAPETQRLGAGTKTIGASGSDGNQSAQTSNQSQQPERSHVIFSSSPLGPIGKPDASDPVARVVEKTADSLQANASITPTISVMSLSHSTTATADSAVAPSSAANGVGGASGRGGWLLPAGYLSTDGNQIVDSAGEPVRIDSVGWGGTDSLVFAPYGLWQSSLEQNIEAIKADGFNTIRVPWSDLLLTASPEETAAYSSINYALNPNLDGLTSLQVLDVLVADAGAAGLKVILDHHDDNGGPGGYGGQQANGLWIDSGPGTNGTDGSGTAGTVDAAKFLADSVLLAQNFTGNSTVIGFDLDNEPTSAGNINWGQGGPTDIQAMYTQVGDAIQAVDPGALIIAEGPEEWSGPAPGMPAGFAEGDLSGVATDPVTLTIANKVVYSVHEYPPDLSGNGSYNPATQIAAMNAGWGYLETEDIAPIWVGETGSNMTSSADQAWIQMLLDYMKGDDGAEGGPTFSGNEQPVSGSWWQWGSYPGQDPDGTETAWVGGTDNAAQQVATDQLLYAPSDVNIEVACFLRNTRILTDRGEIAVEALVAGDRVVTVSGEAKPITWIGTGRARVTPTRRSAATPIRVCKGALGDKVPHRDLRITKGHSIYLENVLIPVEFLVNHRSILWDDLAGSVEFYHIELDRHDVIFADGAPAETYRDEGNRRLFRNARTGYGPLPKAPFAQVLTGGRSVDTIWQQLLERSGGRPGIPLTDDPDLHLIVDGCRLDAANRRGKVYHFNLPSRPNAVRLASRDGIPAELGLARDFRSLGVGVRQIALRQGPHLRIIEADDDILVKGFHCFEPENGYRWTDGDAIVPSILFNRLRSPFEIEVHIAGMTRYAASAAQSI